MPLNSRSALIDACAIEKGLAWATALLDAFSVETNLTFAAAPRDALIWILSRTLRHAFAIEKDFICPAVRRLELGRRRLGRRARRL